MILLVCTGNTCRSPMAEGLLRHHLDAAGVALEARSAGTLGWNGNPATPHAVEVLAERGIDLSHHVSRRLDTAEIRAARLVIAMTRVHAWAVAAHDPDAPRRTFLLGEVVRLGAAVDATALRSAAPAGRGDLVERWVEGLHAQRPEGRPLGRAAEEVADPAGESIDVYRATADRLDRQIRSVVERLIDIAPRS